MSGSAVPLRCSGWIAVGWTFVLMFSDLVWTGGIRMSAFKASVTRRHFLALGGAFTGVHLCHAFESPIAPVPPQPYFAAVDRAVEVLARLGAPIRSEDAEQIITLARQSDSAAVEATEKILDQYTLVRIVTEPDGFAEVTAGGAQKILVEQGWRPFLVRVSNKSGTNARLTVESAFPLVMSSGTGASRAGVPDTINMGPYLEEAWLSSSMYEAPPLGPTLSGAAVEYRVVQLYSRNRGEHETALNAYTTSEGWAAKEFPGRGTHLTFQCLPSYDVVLSVLDANGAGCMASLIIRDDQSRVYPLQGMRLAPDMFFHPQVYRADGETVRLPDGQYTIESKRGPEYLTDIQKVTIGRGQRHIQIHLKRWIDPANWGWYSGDTHIHAGGCLHYDHPTEGVSPETMIRHVRGEGLSIGDVLSWGPSWYYQKQFFNGRAISPAASLEHPDIQTAVHASLQPQSTSEDSESLLRYDVEVSGFPSSVNGHLVLLRLRDQDYPGTKLIQEWPSWNLPILKWAHAQGAVTGYAHCGNGMIVDATTLPNYEIPPMDGIGTQEAIVDVTHGVCDFLSGCDTHPAAELNAWYHMLNCGYRLVMVGETDYPCITGERVGVGRSYVWLDRRPTNNAGYEEWIHGLKEGRLYWGDGRSHFLDFKVNGRPSGERDVDLNGPGIVKVEALIAARLDPERDPHIDKYLASPIHVMSPTWHLERARIGKTRDVPVDLIVNGVAVDRATILADGTPRTLSFNANLTRSSWVALRILPSSHTQPVFVSMARKPIRASKRSAEWCRACVDKLWEVKSPFIRESERHAAMEAYDQARNTYDAIIAQCEEA